MYGVMVLPVVGVKTMDNDTVETCVLCGVGIDAAVVTDKGLACDVCGDALIHDAVCDTIHSTDSENDWVY